MAQFVSVLVDGDNISAKHADQIQSTAAQHGTPNVLRVYTDAQRGSDWHDAPGYRMVHAGTGKNAADILLALDAMELLLTKNTRLFVIASSDGDFTHLATKLREYGAKVIGIGEAKAPSAFRACCTDFVELGSPHPVRLVPKPEVIITDLDKKIRALIAKESVKSAGMRIAVFGQKMRAQHNVLISNLSEPGWRAYLAARPLLYDLDPRGPEAKVRFRPQGFARAA